jgi:predicted esterase
MVRLPRVLAASLCIACGVLPAGRAAEARSHNPPPLPPSQETGFLNRTVDVGGVTYRFQIYLPEEFRRDEHKPWPIILFLHGRGERGSEGMFQTQIGLPLAVRDHPERWPFVIVMPQCLFTDFWTDPEMLNMAMAALDQEITEFHTDPSRTYLTGLSMGGYGAWELARLYPHRWAAIAIASGGPFWSYAPERWQQATTLPGEYARAVGHTPIWMFHGSEDNVVPPRESDLMFNAFKAGGGNVRLWIYQGLHHDSWARAYNEPELPRWLLSHHLGMVPDPPAFAERLVIPLHPTAIKLPAAALDAIAGEYRDANGHLTATVFRQGDALYEKDPHGEVTEVEAEAPNTFFYPLGSIWTRLTVEHDKQGRVTALIYHDDRHEERWERTHPPARTP